MAIVRRSRGFTLMELLTVLVILAVLIAILLPVVAKAQRRAHETTCISNLRQIGQAFQMYSSDYSGNRPPRVQVLANTYLNDNRLLLCFYDSLSNWGGLQSEHMRPPEAPPETVRYSYLFALESFGFSDDTWRKLTERDSLSGIGVCLLHGDRIYPAAANPDTQMMALPSYLDYEGTLLRLQSDGSVVKRQLRWPYLPGGGRQGSIKSLFVDERPGRASSP